MKKIGIISYFNYYNYGSMLQGYALQRAIRELVLDVECENINFRYAAPSSISRWALLKIRLLRMSYYLTHMKEVRTKAKFGHKMKERQPAFDHFLKDYTCTTEKICGSLAELKASQLKYDLYVTGSDQTWSPYLSGGYNETPMFLDFAVPGAKKASYAPSLGVTSLTLEQQSILRDKLSSYSLISCREVKGASLLTEILGREVPSVLDPTLLLTGDQWREVKADTPVKGKYIFCYFLGDRQYYRDFVNQLSLQTGLPIYYIPVNWKEYSEAYNLIWNAGPREFVALIDGAEFVCTDSFHGVAFSSNLNKNFYAFVKHSGSASAGDNSRLFDFMDRIGVADRLLTSYEKGQKINVRPISYQEINKVLASERIRSFGYLKRLIQL